MIGRIVRVLLRASAPPDSRPLPSVSVYDALLAKRTEHPTPAITSKEKISRCPTTPATTITPTLRRRRGLPEQAAVAAVDQTCRRLRLPTVRAVLDEVLTVAGKEQLSYHGFLAECGDRDRRNSIRRVKAANFLRNNWLGDFDFDANPNINPATIHTLATGDWIRKGAPLCLIGDSVTGKSHLLIGLSEPPRSRKATRSNTPRHPARERTR